MLCLLQKEEFEHSHSVSCLHLYNNEVLVLWKWHSLESDDSTENESVEGEQTETREDGSGVSEEVNESVEDDGNDDGVASRVPITHGVVFKCIGVSRDPNSQYALSLASKEVGAGKTVPVELYPEVDNPKNARAIAFRCYVDKKWHRIGYIVDELLEAVHNALDKNEVLSVELEWAKFVIHWSKSGPGWYAGIKIVKKGEWPSVVVRSASTR